MGYVSGVHGELVGMQGATIVVGDDHFGGAPNCPNKSIGGLLIQDSNQKHSDACTWHVWLFDYITSMHAYCLYR